MDSIRVAEKRFGGNVWREAVLSFLYGIWSSDKTIVNNPIIQFNNTVLRWHEERYVGYHSPLGRDPENHPGHGGKDVWIVVDAKRQDVEYGLIRFVKDNTLRHLIILQIMDGKDAGVILSKGRKRGELFVGISGRTFPSETKAMEWEGLRS